MSGGRPLDQGTAAFIQADASALPLANESVAAVVTSPPYNVGIAYDDHDDNMSWDAYEKLAVDSCSEMGRVLISGGRAWINVTPTVPLEIRPPGDHSGRTAVGRISLLDVWGRALIAAGLQIWDYVAWVTMGRGGATAWGSWQSPAAPNLRGEWETIIVAYKDSWPRSTPAEFKSWQDGIGGWTALVSNVWKIQPEQRLPDGHPAPFPEALARRCIRLSTWPGETVLDPFSGQGATVRAAIGLGRNGIGTDVSAAYCEMGERSLAQGSLFAMA